MDLLDFEGQALYFDDPISPEVESLLAQAAQNYAEGKAEICLLRAYFLMPENLSVLVGLYRFYYYQHRLEDTLKVAYRAMSVAAERLGLPDDWRELHPDHLGSAVLRSMGLLRFYLLALKGAGYVSLRLGEVEQGMQMLGQVSALDAQDRLGASALLETVSALFRKEECAKTPLHAVV